MLFEGASDTLTGRAGLVLAASVALVAAPLPSMASSPPAADARAPGRQQQDEACASRPAAAAAAAAAPRSEEGRDLEDPKAAPAAIPDIHCRAQDWIDCMTATFTSGYAPAYHKDGSLKRWPWLERVEARVAEEEEGVGERESQRAREPASKRARESTDTPRQ